MIDAYLERLYAEGVENDSVAQDRSQRMFNITPSTGRFLDLLIKDSRPTRILELGTSNGYSTIWIARAAKEVKATVDSVDIAPAKSSAALANLRDVGLDSGVTLHTGDAGDFLAECESDRYDFLFLDSARHKYESWADDLIRVMAFGTMVVDNAISHAAELSGYVRQIEQHQQLASCVLPIGKGQMVIRRRIDP